MANINLPNNQGMWGRIGFVMGLTAVAITVYSFIERRPIVKEERELLRLNLKRARIDLGLNPETGQPINR